MSKKKHVALDYIQKPVEPPGEGQRIAMSLGTRGGNIVEVQFDDGCTTLCMIPARFNKKLWIRKGGLVIVERPVAESEGAKVSGNVVAVLYPEHLRMFRKQGVPVPSFADAEEGERGDGGVGAASGGERGDQALAPSVDGGASGSEADSDGDSSGPELEANPNQRKAVQYEYTDSDDE